MFQKRFSPILSSQTSFSSKLFRFVYFVEYSYEVHYMHFLENVIFLSARLAGSFNFRRNGFPERHLQLALTDLHVPSVLNFTRM